MGDIKEWSFEFSELKFFLLNRKICRICGTKMKKTTKKTYIGMKKFRGIMTGVSYDKTYEVTIFYYCSKCDKKYSLEELAKGNKRL
ncbi:hypothetical protein SR42_12475 [Clostridium botulinum]|uniref:hypothetical protein n=1 Tax=Clostridium botulinum TaxID=1491 RepID=UPI0005974744|nr:hypothetical protein [Clostridium botulinum]KIL07019.1 hypothetical protein SR42_12475 [Clostridium botulinum]MBY6935703.1 hypothetical protein [Clostridium botulinum]NFL83399.1 hypothetical protein [Clostridium botulinum]NFN13240.1 hypothetical protein [Clostridium botulinum]NFO38309.1 hypothetical protein [Clostridium botulinum]